MAFCSWVFRPPSSLPKVPSAVGCASAPELIWQHVSAGTGCHPGHFTGNLQMAKAVNATLGAPSCGGSFSQNFCEKGISRPNIGADVKNLR